MSRSGALRQQHHLTPISWTPDLSIIVIIGSPFLSFSPGFELPKPSWNAPWSTTAGHSSARMSSLLPSDSSPLPKSICNCFLNKIWGIKNFMSHNLIRAWISRVPKLQAHPNLPQPRWHKVPSHPFLNSVKRKQLVRLSAALFAEYKRRKTVRAPPLKWSRLAALARSRCRNALRIDEAA